jgi:hypothetical protein
MPFPLRLTADLAVGLAVRPLRWKRARPLIVSLAAGGQTEPPSAPIVWIGGPEALDVPETPRFVNSMTAAGRHVFLSTNGILLRRRIHEFQPSSRLHLTIRFDRSQAAHGAHAGRDGAFREALESVRTARLSGFFLCAQLMLSAPREARELERLHGELSKLDFDGFLISLASVPAGDELRSVVVDLRRRLLSRRWALFSRLLEPVLLPAPVVVTARQASPARVNRELTAHLPQRSREESVQTP